MAEVEEALAKELQMMGRGGRLIDSSRAGPVLLIVYECDALRHNERLMVEQRWATFKDGAQLSGGIASTEFSDA